MILAALAIGLVAFGAHDRESDSAPASAVGEWLPSTQPDIPIHALGGYEVGFEDESLPVEGRPVLVGDMFNEAARGWIDWSDAFSPSAADQEHLMDVVDDAGNVIAYFAVDIGWIDLEDAVAADFDYDELKRSHDLRVEEFRDVVRSSGEASARRD